MHRCSETIHDELLVLRAQAGDEGAFSMLLRRWLPVMRRHALRLTGDGAAAEDVLQEACLALVRGLRGLRDPALARGWVLRVVTNKAVDWVRRRGRERRLAREARDREPREIAADGPGCGEAEERGAGVRAACAQLPPEMRAVVSLYYGEGMPIAAVAEAVGAPAGTVKSRLHEARGQIRAFLERRPA